MHAIEQRAIDEGITSLTLDTVPGTTADRWDRRNGWNAAGVIPGYVFDPDGMLCATVVFHKE